MATLKMQGLEEYERLLSKLSSSETVRAVCGATIYAGADIVADAIREGVKSLPTVENNAHGTQSAPILGVTEEQKAGLLDGFGIAPMIRENGYYNVKLGFDGYNGVKTRAYPLGQPNSMIARSINSGTSFRQKIPFVDRAVKSAKNKAEKAMAEKFDEQLRKETGGK